MVQGMFFLSELEHPMGREVLPEEISALSQALQVQVLLAPSATSFSSFMELQSRLVTFITMGKTEVIFEGNQVQRFCCKSSGLKIYLMHLLLFNRQEEMKGNC